MGVNHDDHTKNVSFLLPEDGQWELTPAYDVTHANWGSDWTAQHQMSVNGRFSEITLDDLRTMEIDTMFRALRMLSEKLRRRSRLARSCDRFRRGRRHDQEGRKRPGDVPIR